MRKDIIKGFAYLIFCLYGEVAIYSDSLNTFMNVVVSVISACFFLRGYFILRKYF